MRLYEIRNPILNVSVRYQILDEDQIRQIARAYSSHTSETFMRAVLEKVILNLKTDVRSALKLVPKELATDVLNSLYYGCLMLNPGLDVESWQQIANSPNLVSAIDEAIFKNLSKKGVQKAAVRPVRGKRISREKILNLERHLKEQVIGQDEAITEIAVALKRSYAGLHDEQRPLGVFLFAGSSGVGKTLVAKELHKYLFGDTEIARIDCGEFQHKHENQKIIGTAPGYIGYEDGGQLTKQVAANPFSVVLLDEVEKAHQDLWHTFLRVFDEGWLTDGSGKRISFHNTIIIMTTNLGNKHDDISSVGFGSKSNSLPKREATVRKTNDAIKKYFTPEFLNRLDKIAVFNHLSTDDYKKIAELELQELYNKLEKRGFILTFDDSVVDAMVRNGVSHVQGARGMSQLRRDRIENQLAELILEHRYSKGTIFKLHADADDFQVAVMPSVTEKRTPTKSAPIIQTAPLSA